MSRRLTQYRGGGYDGCHWEWNFFMDIDGEHHDISGSYYYTVFHDIFSSGRCGISKASDKYKLNDRQYVYDLDNPDEVKDFVTESQPQLVLGVAKYIEENTDVDMKLTCPICEQEWCADEIMLHPHDYKGYGGTAIAHESYLCNECHGINSCAYCREFYDPEYQESEAKYHEVDSIIDENGYCMDCWDHSPPVPIVPDPRQLALNFN